jgi:hypothetical protein
VLLDGGNTAAGAVCAGALRRTVAALLPGLSRFAADDTPPAPSQDLLARGHDSCGCAALRRPGPP